MIHSNSYTRRCRIRECSQVTTYRLPALKKAIIYLDQHLISDMMKALHPGTDPKRRERADYARRVFEVLDRAVKLQIAICPDSVIHARESMVTPYRKDLERMYEQFSCKVSFPELWDIKIAQVVEHALNWHRGEPQKPFKFDAQALIDEDVHGWHDNIMIGVPFEPGPGTIESVRTLRDRIGKSLTPACQHWAAHGGNFDEFRNDMIRVFGLNAIKEFNEHLAWLEGSRAGVTVPTPDDAAGPLCMEFLNGIVDALRAEGLALRTAQARALAYFTEGNHSSLPYIHVESLLYAALGWQFAHGGRKRNLGRGTANDLSAIMHFLPYCDAMYVDNEMLGLASDHRVARELERYGTRLFSRRNLDKFIGYVEDLVSCASPDHLARIRSVYGEDCGEPFTQLYKQHSAS